MKYSIIYKLLIRTVCAEYYRLNAGFFFIIIAFAFGLLRPIEHIALATYIVHSYFLLALLFGLWTLYTIKTIQFTLRTFALDENVFLYNLYLLPFPVKVTALLLVQFILYEPVVLYAAFMGYYAVLFQQYTALFYVVLFNTVSVCVAALYYVYRLKYISSERKQSRIATYMNQHFTKPYFTFYLYQVLNKQLSLYILTKIFSLILIAGTVKLYAIEDYSPVLLYLGVLVAFGAHATLTFHFNRFEQLDVLFLKNLPLSMSRRFSYNVLTYIAILIPEVLLLLRHLTGDIVSVWSAFQLLLFGVSLQLALHSYALYRQLDLEKFIRHIFFLILFFFVLILFRIHILLITALNIAAAYAVYRKYFYQAEIIILKDEPEE